MAVGVERRAKKVASRLDNALLLQPVSNTMSYNPLTQPSGPGFPVPETITAIHQGGEDRSEYSHTSTTTSLTGQTAAADLGSQQANKKRRPSKDKATTSIRRSSSTPHMRNLALGTTGELSPTGDKRRNKLGYHRTSVACGHCRRRKIRCLVAHDEPTGRCANCIRLKKECNFYPVDQTPETQRSQTGASSKDTGTGAQSSTTSSPRHPPLIPGEKVEEFRPPLPGVPSSIPSSRYGIDSDMDHSHHGLPASGMPMQPSYGFPHAIDTQWPPVTGFLPSSSVAESPSSSTGYWRPSPSTANSTYGSESNISGGRTPATMSTTSTVSYGGGHPDGHNWGPQGFQPPTRSMSYGNIEGLPQQYANQGLGAQQQDYPRRTSPYPYPTTIDTTPATVQSTSLGPQTSAPLSAPILPNHQYNYPPPWNPNPYGGGPTPGHEMPVQSRSMSGQWYPEPAQLGQVQEEGAPQVAFNHHGMRQFYSGP